MTQALRVGLRGLALAVVVLTSSACVSERPPPKADGPILEWHRPGTMVPVSDIG